MAVGALRLEHRLAVPLQPQPGEAPENRVHRLERGPLSVGVPDTKAEDAARVPRV